MGTFMGTCGASRPRAGDVGTVSPPRSECNPDTACAACGGLGRGFVRRGQAWVWVRCWACGPTLEIDFEAGELTDGEVARGYLRLLGRSG